MQNPPLSRKNIIFRGRKQTYAQKTNEGTSLVVQWLRLCIPCAGDPGLIPGQGTRFHMPQLRLNGEKKKKISSRKKDLLIQKDNESYN